MPLSFHPGRRTLYVAAESSEGTYIGSSTLFAVGKATLPTESLKFDPVVDFHDRRVDGPSAQSIRSIPGAQKATISFTSRLVGSNSAGGAGVLSDLLKTCMTETISAGTSVEYTWNENSTNRLSLGWGIIRDDGGIELEHAIAGAGLQKVVIHADDKGKPIMCDWTFLGKIAYETSIVVELDDATPNTSIIYVDDFAKGFTFKGLTVRSGILSRSISKFSLEISNKGELGADVSDASCYDWFHNGVCDVTLKADAAKTTAGAAPDIANLVSGAQASAAFTVSNAAGATFTLTLPNLQPKKLSEGSRDGGNISTWDIEAEAHRTADGSTAQASDAFKLTFGHT